MGRHIKYTQDQILSAAEEARAKGCQNANQFRRLYPGLWYCARRNYPGLLSQVFPSAEAGRRPAPSKASANPTPAESAAATSRQRGRRVYLCKHHPGDHVGPHRLPLVAVDRSDPKQAVGVFECPVCKTHFEAAVHSVVKGATRTCGLHGYKDPARPRYYSDEQVIAMLKAYDSRKELREADPSLTRLASRRGLLDQVFGYEPKGRRPHTAEAARKAELAALRDAKGPLPAFRSAPPSPAPQAD